jgi:hypothetical protein
MPVNLEYRIAHKNITNLIKLFNPDFWKLLDGPITASCKYDQEELRSVNPDNPNRILVYG